MKRCFPWIQRWGHIIRCEAKTWITNYTTALFAWNQITIVLTLIWLQRPAIKMAPEWDLFKLWWSYAEYSKTMQFSKAHSFSTYIRKTILHNIRKRKCVCTWGGLWDNGNLFKCNIISFRSNLSKFAAVQKLGIFKNAMYLGGMDQSSINYSTYCRSYIYTGFRWAYLDKLFR